jgi:hypothetical protein
MYSASVSKGLNGNKNASQMIPTINQTSGVNLLFFLSFPNIVYIFILNQIEVAVSHVFVIFHIAHPDYVTVQEYIYVYCSPCHKHTGKHAFQLTNSTCVC